LFHVWGFYFIHRLYDEREQTTFFPSGDPNFICVYLKMPVGTDVKYTDSVTCLLEKEFIKFENELPGNRRHC
jgi:multidrug efflux pump subunit AcrB